MTQDDALGPGAASPESPVAGASVPAPAVSSTHQPDASMPRRAFLGAAASVAAGGLIAACTGPDTGGGGPAVVTRPNVQWRLASSYPRSLDALYGTLEILAETLSGLTDGRFQIRPYAAGELVPALQVLDAAQQGTVQVGHTAAYYYTGKNPAFAFDTAMPFGLTSRQQTAWILDGGGLELMRSVYADFGLIQFLGNNTGAQMGGWFRRELRGLADLRGLNMRIPGLGGEVMSRLGVTVQVLGGSEIFPALERGAIDAAEWVGPYDDEKLGFHQVARYYYYPGWWEPGPAVNFVVNRSAWDALPSEYQLAFQAAVAVAGPRAQTIYDARNPEALARIVASGTQLRPFPDEIMRAAAEVSRDLMESQASADPRGYGRIYEAWKRFRDDSFRWFGTAEHAFAQFAYGSASA